MTRMASADRLAGSCLADLTALELRPADSVAAFGPTLVIAPHPDDESLGCGGAIALLRGAGLPVHVLLVSDGSGSHPGSRRFPPPVLAALRERELRAALALLGVDPAGLSCLGLPDRHVPRAGSDGFQHGVACMVDVVRRAPFEPATVLLPWRRDPHTDHRGAWELAMSVLGQLGMAPRVVEYPIWAWELAEAADLPGAGEVDAWRLDIASVLGSKLAAIGAHVSQTTPLVDDAASSWYLRSDVLAHFGRPWEVFLEG
jgi:LmbE family N-acetylglucosaminyl deacetylase